MKLINYLLSLISDHSLFPHNTPTINWFGPLSPQCRYRLSFPCPCDNTFFFLFFFGFRVLKEKRKKKAEPSRGEMWQPISQFLLSLINNYYWMGIS